MALKIFGTDSAKAADRENFSDDIVGRFRSGHVVNGRPQSLEAWRVTTGDPAVAETIHDLLGGSAPQEWETESEENIEVFTNSSEVVIVVESPDDVRQQMVLRSADGKIVRAGDGETISYPPELAGQPDPNAGKPLAELKNLARAGMGAKPETTVTFRLAENPDLGKFRFTSSSWSLAKDMDYFDTLAALAKIDGPARIRLSLVRESFTAKTGPRAGQTVSFMKPFLKVEGPA